MSPQNKGVRHIFFVIVFLFGQINIAFSGSLQNNIVIKGQVLSQDNIPVRFATVKHKESGKVASADADGLFILETNLINGKGTLIISAIGYTKIEVRINANNNNLSKLVLKLQENHYELEQVIVTGQLKPTPVDSSIYKVKLISAEKIQSSGSTNLSELLINEANIRMSTDLVLGSQIEMMGMDGQNVKIMVDGVPVIGRLDGNVDLSQINLDNISHVEVIEGPMSVVYGNNALAGTINLITKQNKYHNLQAQAKGYAEDIGRYSGNLNISKKMGRHTLSIDGGYEHFSGVDFDAIDRSMDWKPKDLYRANLSWGVKLQNWHTQLKAGLSSNRLWLKGDMTPSFLAYDQYFYTNRYDISGSLTGSWKDKNHLNVVASYNYYDRSDQAVTIDLTTLEEDRQEKESSQEVNQKMLRGIYGYTFAPNKFSVQSGIDFNIEEMKGPRIDGSSQSLGDYAAFLNLKYQPFSSLEIQPGLRYAYNTDYDAPVVYSLNLKWNLLQNLVWRASVAKGYRAPNIKELYYRFVDSNHEIYGNSNLEAENSDNYNTNIEYTYQAGNYRLDISSNLYYNNITNLITLVQEENSTAYSYSNIAKYESTGGDISLDFNFKNWGIKGGYGLTGRYNSYTESNGLTRFNLTHDYFTGINFIEQKSKIRLSADYKYNGSIPFFYTDTEDNLIKEGHQEPYQTLNVSLTRHFFKRKLQAIVGAKNLFDVTTVNQVRNNGGGAHSGSGGVPVSYGRSYFVSITYKLYK